MNELPRANCLIHLSV